MTRPPVPLVVASLPSRSVEETRKALQSAVDSGADVAEVRFDRWSATDRGRAGELFPAPIPMIATLRSHAEGGEGPDEPEERRAWRSSISALPFGWVDLETDRDVRRGGPVSTGSAATGRIYSAHLPEGTPVSEVHRRLAESSESPGIRKVVVPASVRTALQIVAELPPPGEAERVVLTTRASGPLLRAWSRKLGFPMVYASLPSVAGGLAPVEPSQIPVDRLRPFLHADPAGPLFAVAGRPIAHSISPDLHHAWMRRRGKIGLYIPLEFESDAEFVESLAPLAEGGFVGLNVTHPFKAAALGAATTAGRGAIACGCANTLTFRDGAIAAENTDLLAVLRRLAELRSENLWPGDEVLIVGTGGAARATLEATRTLGVPTRLLGRDRKRTQELASAFEAEVADPATAAPVSLVVHATTVGRDPGDRLDVPLDRWLGANSLLLDFVYRAQDPALAEFARVRGARYEDGQRLLGWAAAASFEIWWGEAPTSAEVDDALRGIA